MAQSDHFAPQPGHSEIADLLCILGIEREMTLKVYAKMETVTMLEQEIGYFNAHRDELLAQYRERFVVVKGNEVRGAFNTIDEALAASAKMYGMESVLIRQVRDGEPEVSVPALTLGILRPPQAA